MTNNGTDLTEISLRHHRKVDQTHRKSHCKKKIIVRKKWGEKKLWILFNISMKCNTDSDNDKINYGTWRYFWFPLM